MVSLPLTHLPIPEVIPSNCKVTRCAKTTSQHFLACIIIIINVRNSLLATVCFKSLASFSNKDVDLSRYWKCYTIGGGGRVITVTRWINRKRTADTAETNSHPAKFQPVAAPSAVEWMSTHHRIWWLLCWPCRQNMSDHVCGTSHPPARKHNANNGERSHGGCSNRCADWLNDVYNV